jgi:hypothetical protein
VLAHLSAQAVACLLYILLAHTVELLLRRIRDQHRRITALVALISKSIVKTLVVLDIRTVHSAEGL